MIEVKITVDAATFTKGTSYSVGMLARNGEGEVILGTSKLFQGNVRPDFAEALAIKEALSWSKLNKWNRVVMESDCLAVVQAIRSKLPMHSPFGDIVMECRKLVKELNIALFFIRRFANMVAHLITRESCSFPGRVFDGRSDPVNLRSILLDDLSS